MWLQSPPDPESVARFSAAFERLAGPNGGRMLLAVSGGPDSLALLILAHAAFPERIIAATVNHGLRIQAAAEADFVARLCASASIAHAVLHPLSPITGNLQSEARVARYALLADHARAAACEWIATAHHADDQLETMLMRLARGSGIDGMAGIRARNGQIVRPLLDFSKAELEAICAAAGIEPVRDPSNEDSDFDRVAMRQWLAFNPHPLSPARAARSASALADASEALGWVTDRLAAEHIERKGESIALDPSGLPREIVRRLLLKAIAAIDPLACPRGDALDRAIGRLPHGDVMTLGNVACRGGTVWTLTAAPPRRTG